MDMQLSICTRYVTCFLLFFHWYNALFPSKPCGSVGRLSTHIKWPFREGGNHGLCAWAAFSCLLKPLLLAKPLTVCTPACESISIFLPGRGYLCGCCFNSCSLCTFRVTFSIFTWINSHPDVLSNLEHHV